MIRILIIDDQELVLRSLKELIKLDEKLKIVGTAKNGQEGIELVERLQPDVAIIDLTMPLKNGIETTYLIAKNYPKTKVLIFTSSDGRMLNKAMLAGAKGYLHKNSSVEDLIAAIRAIERGNVYIGKGILNRVQLSSVDSQQIKIEHINLWLAKEVINCWSKCSSTPLPTAKQIISDLGFSQSGLSQMEDYLCHLDNTNFTVREELKQKARSFFTEVNDSDSPDDELVKKRRQIYDWLNEEGNIASRVNYLVVLRNNYQILQTANSEKIQKTISSFWQQSAPQPLVSCLNLINEYLSDWLKFLKEEYKNNLIKGNSALNSLNYLLEVKQDEVSNKQELCERAIIFIYQCKIDTEVNKLLSQIILKASEQINTYLDILDETNNLLSRFAQQLDREDISEVVTLIPPFSQLKQQVSPDILRRDFEKQVGYSINQWGICRSFSILKLNNLLLKRLRPIAQKIYSDLRKEALAVSFLEYAEYSNQ